MHFRRPPEVVVGLLATLLSVLIATDASAVDRRDLGIYQIRDGVFTPAAGAMAEGVTDPIFGFLMGVLAEDLYGAVDTAYFDSVATTHGGSKMPYDAIRRMERWPDVDGADAMVRITWETLEFAIPYSILGYHPGQIRFSRIVEMLHWKVGDRDFSFDVKEDRDDPDSETEAVEVAVRDAHLFIVFNGSMEFDIDGWLDRLLGGKLDDVDMRGFFVFREGEEQIGLGFGYNKEERGRTGAFDFTKNESLFPAKREYLTLGREMRTMAEERLKVWRETRREALEAIRTDDTRR